MARGTATKLWAILSVLLFITSTMCGQAVNATLLGMVTDLSGAVVPNAKVTVVETNTGIAHTAPSNQSGNYEFPNIPPGKYSVTVEQPGFKKETRSNIDVVVNSTVRVNMVLQPGAVQETIEVTGATPILQTDRADVGSKIETKQVEDIPLTTNRNFQGLLNLVPGTTRAHREHSEFFNAQDSLSTEVNGASRLANNLQLEGVDDNERTGLLQVLIPPIEAIQTVDVTTSNYSAEFGRAGGAVTNVILKSGTNGFHGAAYEFNRISALAAKNYFNNGPNPPGVYNYYGANIGGPIYKNKTFFFVDFLLINDHRGQFNTSTIPTADFRNGDFSAMLPLGIKIYDPATGNPDGTGRQQVSCNGQLNVICPNRISPIAQKILALLPMPNLPGYSANFTENTHFIKDTHSYDVKVDHNISERDRLSGRYSFSGANLYQQPEFGAAGGPIGGGFQGTGVQNAYDAAGYYTHTLSSSLLAEVRVGVSHYRNITRNTDYGTKASEALGIPGVNLDPFTSGLTSIDIGNYSSPLVGYSASMPWNRGETNIDVVNSWTKIKGNHTLKWGGEYRRVRDDLVQGQTFSPRGIWQYREGQTALNLGTATQPKSSATNFANDFASFLFDVPNQIGRDVNVTDASYRANQIFFYGQDQWTVTPKLTLNLGLRWELYPPAMPNRKAGFSNYDPAGNDLVIAGVGGNPRNLGLDTHYTDFAPRFGIAYRATENMVVRGSYGISYSPFPDNAYAYNFPVRQNNAYNAANSFAPATYSNGQAVSLASGFPAPTVATIPPNGIVPASLASNYFVVDKGFREPYLEFWNVSVQHTLPKNFVADLAYVGNVGRNIPTQYNLNAATVPGLGAKGRPEYPRTADTILLFKRVTSNYNALQAKLDRRFRGGFMLTTAYTWSKAMGYKTDGGGTGAIQNYLDFRRNYNPVEYDRTHTLVQSYIYDLPFGHGRKWLQSGAANWVMGGWQVSGVLTLMTGKPLVWTASGTGLNAPGTSQTPNLNGPFKVLNGVGSQAWFDVSDFSTPIGPVLGNVNRNSYRGPGFFNLDASLFRRIPVNERIGLEFRAEAFGVTNTPQFGNPNTNLSSSSFGHIDASNGGATGNRTLQLGAKVVF
jgi:outer membrane receptor protein involved in Fe transport